MQDPGRSTATPAPPGAGPPELPATPRHSASPVRTPTLTRRSVSGAASALLVLLLLVAGCGLGGSEDSSSESGEGGARADSATAPEMVAGDADTAGRTGGAVTDGALTGASDVGVSGATEAGRRQTFQATVDLGVDRLETAVADIAQRVESVGGFVESEDIDLGDTQFARITYRVPAPEFRATLEAIGKVGDLRSQDVTGTDVTATSTDLESRVATLATSVDRLRGFLAEADDINQITSLESELTRREGELESVEAQRRALADQVELSTISVTFDASTAEPATVEDRSLPTFLGGLETGWDVVVTIAAFTAGAAGLLLPFLPVVAVVVLLVRRTTRRRGRRGAMPDTAEPTPPGPPTPAT